MEKQGETWIISIQKYPTQVKNRESLNFVFLYSQMCKKEQSPFSLENFNLSPGFYPVQTLEGHTILVGLLEKGQPHYWFINFTIFLTLVYNWLHSKSL